MARDRGIETPATYLVHRGKLSYFLIRRYDIGEDGSRNHVHTVAGMLGRTYAERVVDYRQVFRLTNGLTRDNRQLEQLFRRMALNVLACNRDDHAKNLSYIMDATGSWRLSPAYNLTYAAQANQAHAMSLNGAVSGRALKDFETLAEEFGVKRWKECINDVAEALSRWPEYAMEARVSAQTMEKVGTCIRRVHQALRGES